MLRAIYVALLRLHPRCFRQRFADEMLWIFDRTAKAGVFDLFADGLRSLVTQWMFRGNLDEPSPMAGVAGPAADRVPVFYTSGSDIPPPGALLNGLILSVFVFGAACFALAHSGGHARVFTYYGNEFHAGPPVYGQPSGPPMTGSPTKSGQPASPGIWGRLTSAFRKPSGSAAETAALAPKAAEATPGPARESDNSGPALILMNRTKSLVYFQSVPVLAALDTDHDGQLSPEEIGNAPTVLRGLDKNQDGRLDVEECGYRPHHAESEKGRRSANAPKGAHAKRKAAAAAAARKKQDEAADRRARIEFMRLEPVLAALDADHDMVISPDEIRNASAALKSLDRNHDGHLTIDEVVPDPVAKEVAAIFRLDTDFDGKISAGERKSPFARDVRLLLDAADRNGKPDGDVTWEELSTEIHRRADLNHDGVVTWEELMQARTSGALNGPPTADSQRIDPSTLRPEGPPR